MPRKFIVNPDFYDTGCKIFSKSEMTINPGFTVLVGCNGIGKSTFIKTIKQDLKSNNIKCIDFDNLVDGGSNSTGMAIVHNDYMSAIQNVFSSEGEVIINNIGRLATQFGNTVRYFNTSSGSNELWIVLDAIDSGLSIDNIEEVKSLFDLVIQDCKSSGIEVYIVASANEYEMARGEQCLDVYNGEYIEFKSYEDFRRFILKSRKIKDSRYKKKKK